MKIVLIVGVIFLVTFNGFSQDLFTYEKVIKADSISKKMIYANVHDWFASTYNSAQDVIQMDDKEAGIIIGNGSMKYGYKGWSYICFNGWINYTIKVYTKDNRYKVVITNFKHSVQPGNSPNCELGLITNDPAYTMKGMNKKYQNKVWNDIKTKMKAYSHQVFADLEEKTSSLKIDGTDDDW